MATALKGFYVTVCGDKWCKAAGDYDWTHYQVIGQASKNRLLVRIQWSIWYEESGKPHIVEFLDGKWHGSQSDLDEMGDGDEALRLITITDVTEDDDVDIYEKRQPAPVKD